MPGRRGRGTCLASPGAKRDAATRHPSAGGRPGARARNHEREPELDIIISNASDKPIYDQIVSQMKALILTGELGEGQQLPSIRALAGDLRISVITTKRAYAELELQGFIETVPGKGSFVAGGNLELLREERHDAAQHHEDACAGNERRAAHEQLLEFESHQIKHGIFLLSPVE